MGKIVRLLIINLLIVSSFLLMSCGTQAKISLLENGAVKFEFSGSIVDSFKDLIGENNIVDEGRISLELENAGFSNVKVSSKNDNIFMSFIDDNKSSYLFNSGIISVDKGNIKISITPEKFKEFYYYSGEDIQSIIDVFISPVINDEKMSEEEYIETINVSYGEETGSELSKSVVEFIISDKISKNRKKSLDVTKILCGISVNF